MTDCDKLRELASKWKKEALQQVPEDYASRGLEYKYLKLDNEAAGLISCADELLELLDSDAVEHCVDLSSDKQTCPTCKGVGLVFDDGYPESCPDCR